VRQIVQLEGSSWCGPIVACMAMDHFGMAWDLDRAKKRIADYRKMTLAKFTGCFESDLASYLTEQGMAVFVVDFGFPYEYDEEDKRFYTSHKPRESRLNTWYRVYDMLRAGYVGIVATRRDAGKNHFVCVDDAFIRAQERWFSIVDPIRGPFEEQAERFFLTVEGHGDATKWLFVKKPSARFASAAEVAAEVPAEQDESPTDGTSNSGPERP
jgi:hypothetical protein